MGMTGVYACLFEAVCDVTTVPSHLKWTTERFLQFNHSTWLVILKTDIDKEEGCRTPSKNKALYKLKLLYLPKRETKKMFKHLK